MYFLVLGKNIELSMKELELVISKDNIKKRKGRILLIDKDISKEFNKFGGVIKFGRVFENLEKIDFAGKELLGVEDRKFGSQIKKEFGIKRFKQVPVDVSDIDIKEKGIEIMDFDIDGVGVVDLYQNIDFFAEVDFNKPINSMQIGMMPAKLTNIMINIGLSYLDKNTDQTIYDPFVGLGTTGLLVNAFGYNFIGSDINITPTKQNFRWWEKNNYYIEDKKNTLFKHDVRDEFKKNFLKDVDLIVSEGWLGPIVRNKIPGNMVHENIQKIWEVYKGFFDNVDKFWDHITIVITIPVYLFTKNYIKKELEDYILDSSFEVEFIDSLYKRKGQKVARQVLILKK